MSKVIAPFLFLLIAIGLFFSYIDPAYKAVQALQYQEERLDQALTDSKELKSQRESLLARLASFTDSDRARLNKLLPDNVDNVRLVIDIDSIAASYTLTVRDYSFNTLNNSAAAADANQTDVLGAARLSFTVTGAYRDFKAFMFDLESSLRLMDTTSFSVSTTKQAEGDTKTTGNTYTVSVQTYWLK